MTPQCHAGRMGALLAGLAWAAGAAVPSAQAQAQAQVQAQAQDSQGAQMSPLPGFLDRQSGQPRAPEVAPPTGMAAPRDPAPQGVPLAPVAPAPSPYVPAAPMAAPATPAPAPAASPAPPTSPVPAPAPEPSAVAPAGPLYPDVWQPRQGVELVALDKVNARSVPLRGGLGEKLTFGALTVTALSCQVRPPTQPADAAAFLEITDATGTVPPFRGWMWLAEPSRNLYESPLYDIHLTGCR